MGFKSISLPIPCLYSFIWRVLYSLEVKMKRRKHSTRITTWWSSHTPSSRSALYTKHNISQLQQAYNTCDFSSLQDKKSFIKGRLFTDLYEMKQRVSMSWSRQLYKPVDLLKFVNKFSCLDHLLNINLKYIKKHTWRNKGLKEGWFLTKP